MARPLESRLSNLAFLDSSLEIQRFSNLLRLKRDHYSRVTAPLVGRLGGTGIFMSSGDDGIVSSGRSGIGIEVASLL